VSERTPAGARRWQIDRAWIVIGLVLLGALGVMLLGALMAPERQDDMWVNIVGRSAQLIALALAGGVVGAVIHDRDAARAAVQRRDAALRVFLDEVEAAFAEAKTSRRMLRTLGFDGQREMQLTPEQVEGFRAQMARLNDAELQFEGLARKAAALAGPLTTAAEETVARLAAIHEYLNGVMREWEASPDAVRAEGTNAALLSWPRFSAFVGYDDEALDSFRRGVAEVIFGIETLVGSVSTGGPDAHP
jgi:hypothetical protein